jgi:hypothetical protein
MARLRLSSSREIQTLLNQPGVRAATQKATEAVADGVRAMGISVGDRDGGARERELPVTTKLVTTDRPHGLVTLAHPAGMAVQAKHGALTKAAAQAGLDVRGGK